MAGSPSESDGGGETVLEIGGAHHVADGDGKLIAGPFDSNALAWRWMDRHNNEPVSRTEAVSSWFMSKIGTDDRV